MTTAWWKEERGERIFVDYNQNCRDRTIASAYSLRPIPGAPVSTPLTWRSSLTSPTPASSRSSRSPTGWPTATPGRRSTTWPTTCTPLLDLWREQGEVELNYPPDYPKMPGGRRG